MDGCLRCWTQAELDLLDADPSLVPDEIVRKFAWEVADHFDQDEYELAWRRLGYRVVEQLEIRPDAGFTRSMYWTRWPTWPETERTALRTLFVEAIVRTAGDEERWPNLDELIQAAAQLDQSLVPWLRLVDKFPDAVVAYLADQWSSGVYYSPGHFGFGSWLFWENPTAGDEIREWLLSPALCDRLLEVVSAAALSAVEQIEWLQWEISTR